MTGTVATGAGDDGDLDPRPYPRALHTGRIEFAPGRPLRWARDYLGGPEWTRDFRRYIGNVLPLIIAQERRERREWWISAYVTDRLRAAEARGELRPGTVDMVIVLLSYPGWRALGGTEEGGGDWWEWRQRVCRDFQVSEGYLARSERRVRQIVYERFLPRERRAPPPPTEGEGEGERPLAETTESA